MEEYGKWATFQCEMKNQRQTSIKELDFPFEYRPGQKKLVLDVYRTIMRQKLLFMQAPTGVGKTISTIFPAVKAVGEDVYKRQILESEYPDAYRETLVVLDATTGQNALVQAKMCIRDRTRL